MFRIAGLLLLLFPFVAIPQEKPPKGEKLEIGVFGNHFEKNNSGLMGETSVLRFEDIESFEKVFGTVPPMGLGKNPGRKTVPVTKATFEKSVVFAIIKRGDSPTTFSDTSASVTGDTVSISFKSETGPATTARFASPLILSLPKGQASRFVFIENGKEIGTIK